MNPATLLCFDFGSKRIGIAVGQTVTGTASPLLTLDSHNHGPNWKKIEELIADWRPDALVVGIPLTMQGKTQTMTAAAEKFARQLDGRFHLPVYRMDERLSTYAARDRAGDIEGLDAVAAQAILESWMHDNYSIPEDDQDPEVNVEHASP